MTKRGTWNETDRQAFADGARTKANTFKNRKRETNRLKCRKSKQNKHPLNGATTINQPS